jgi:sugar phosphate isomerase/epimerase
MLKLSYSTNGLTEMDLFTAVSEVKRVGYDGVELSFQPGQFDPFRLTEKDLDNIKSFFEEKDINPVCISTATTFFLSEIPHEPSLICLDADKREQRIRLIRKGIQIAQKIGVPIVSFQSGYLRKEHMDNPLAHTWALLVEGIKECLKDIKNVILVIEPEPGMFIETIDEAIALINEVGSHNFRLHLDICHTYCTEDDYIEAIKKHVSCIEYMHLADIKEGYNLKLVELPSDLIGSAEIDLDAAGYLLYLSRGEQFIFLDKRRCLCFYCSKMDQRQIAQINGITNAIYDKDTIMEFVDIKGIIYDTSNTDIDLEIKAFLGSVGGIDLKILKKAAPILKYLRMNNGVNAGPLIHKPVCNTIKGKVHYHEFPGKGEIDFVAIFQKLKEGNYSGYITVELYNHSKVWKNVLPNSRKYLLECM